MVTPKAQTRFRLTSLHNRYYVMRHGQSLANTAGLIVSHPDNGLFGYGLSETGRQQVEAGLNNRALDNSTRIFSSDFKRTRETAILASEKLGCVNNIEFDTRLRERNFGKLELGSDRRYPEVWVHDQKNTVIPGLGVELVESVLDRALNVVIDLEQRFNNENCLLISHGDILQILQTAFNQLAPNRHRDIPHLETAELRLLNPNISQ